ncbi:MAG: hypothetical protein KAU22_11140, partial [Desulfuromonadales bacterium]|nr:hypothetical protein [Desulfuromonadales bacterium]
MRCPKCGYNSFDHFDSCKKCGNDLIAFKQSYGIKSVLFPGEMSPAEESTAVEVDNATADAAVTAATVPAKTPAPEPKSSDSDSDDFGFDFMGDSAEDDDLSFDELFEEAPEDEDIEETIEGPQAATEEESQLDDDFGFDPVDDVVETLENDFSFDDEELESISKSEDAGIKEDPQRPFDLPESLQDVEAPEASLNNFTGESSVPAIAAEIDEIVTSAPDIDAAPERYVFEPIEASEPNWEALPSTDEPEPLVAVAPPQTSSDIAVT